MSAALTPLATALENIFAANTEIRVVDYQKGFTDLWQTGLQGTLSIEITAFLICGTNPPPEAFSGLIPQEVNSGVDFSDHFTAYSWASSFRLLNPKSSVKIVILNDSIPQGTAADLVALFARDISGVSAVIPGIICLTTPSLSDIIAALASESPQPLRIGQQAILRGIIQQHLVPEPDKHHQLGNVVGSLMLTTQAGTPGLGKAALAGLLQSLQPATGFKVADGQHFAFDQRLRTSISRGVPVVLFDDMGALWKPFVQQWVPDNLLHVPPVNNGSRLDLVERLRILTSDPLQTRRLNASDFGVSKETDGKPFILLLDLRLFPAGSSGDEAEFIDELKKLAADVSKASDLKWPAISDIEAKAVEAAWYLGKPDAPNYRKARTWLPRLISLIDPTLPIVVFSSTQDPEVLKEFQSYGNIVTDFAKPMFRGIMGEAEEWIGATHRSFEKALRYALKISSVQLKLRNLSTARVGDSKKLCDEAHPAQVEIFIDESGVADEKSFAIGAIVLISGSTPFNHGSYRDDALRGLGPGGLWGLDDLKAFSHITQLPSVDRRLPKGDLVEVGIAPDGTNRNNLLNITLTGIEELIGKQGATIIACSLLSNESSDPSAIASNKHPFHRYRNMLTRLLEAILFHSSPVVQAIERGATICIDAATTENPAAAWRPAELTADFGAELFYRTIKGQQVLCCRTIDKSDVLPIVSNLLARNGREHLGNKVIRSRALPLPDFLSCETNPKILNHYACSDPKLFPKPLPKPLHYLADWIANFTRTKKKREEFPNIPVLKAWFESGFLQTDGDELRQHLRCQRKWAQGARLPAVKDCATISDTPDGAFALNPRLKVKASHWLSALSGQEIISLFHTEEFN
jgi:hypothetical protein